MEDKVKLDINYVKSRYEKEYEGVKYLLYPAQNTKNLFIIFNGAVAQKYCMWSWFWDHNETWESTTYLFLKDDNKSFYVNSSYEKIIKKTIQDCHISTENIFSYGISMGAYSALQFGIRMGFKGVLIHDLFANEAMIKSLASEIHASYKMPLIFMQYSNSKIDLEHNEMLLNALSASKKLFLIVRKVDTEIHATCAPPKKFLEQTQEYFNNIFAYAHELCKLQNVGALPDVEYIKLN